ncbi:MAG: gamma-glutamyltransferase family protein [Armatimonadota bacterium]|nr:gamma-glutamyltransferase family protein [Armatimonadota bacterium]MDR7470106.1 gamma-glutamyltransferase family protein [Armatimonadota bacterium]
MSGQVHSHGFELEGSATRPVIRGRHLVVACGHYLAALAGMRMRDLGGNAIDAGVAMAFAQAVLEPQSYGFGGECPILIYAAHQGRVVAINGNTRAPAAATIEWFRERGMRLIPGDGFLPAGVPAAPDALITALQYYGRLTLGEVLAPAIELAAHGFPVYEGMRDGIAATAERFRREWPSSAAIFLPGGRVPEVGETWRNPHLARTFERLVAAEHDSRHLGRHAALRAARERFYRGDIAREIVAFQRETKVRDASGGESAGLLSEEDLASFETRVETPVTINYRGYDVYKCGPWSQGPVFLQQLALLEGFDLALLGQGSADYIHVLVEAAKLAFADRERYYGDPQFVDVPLRGLLSKAYAAERRALIDMRRASLELRPGNPYPFEGREQGADLRALYGRAGDAGTTGTRAIDAEGNMFSATPSGGWLYGSPVIPDLGFCLGTRCQIFWLDPPDHPNALRPRKQPRTTLTPSLVLKDGRPYMVFGTPGIDNQDQWTLQFFLNVVDFGMDLQDAIDAPAFHSVHFPRSFYPKQASPGELVVEARVPPGVREELERRGHVLTVVPGWSLNFTTAVAIDPQRGVIEGAASSRGERNYALGW